MNAEPPAVDRVSQALVAAGASGAAAGIRLLDGAARTAAQAAEQLGTTPAQIANSLVFLAEGDGDGAEPVLVLASGGHRVDTTKVALVLGVGRLRRADPETVRAATGVAIGGVPPLGHPQPLRTVVDVSLERYDEVWAAAGHPHAVFPTTYAELLHVTGGTPAEVAAT